MLYSHLQGTSLNEQLVVTEISHHRPAVEVKSTMHPVVAATATRLGSTEYFHTAFKLHMKQDMKEVTALGECSLPFKFQIFNYLSVLYRSSSSHPISKIWTNNLLSIGAIHIPLASIPIPHASISDLLNHKLHLCCVFVSSNCSLSPVSFSHRRRY